MMLKPYYLAAAALRTTLQRGAHLNLTARSMMTTSGTTSRVQKEEGTISDLFTSLTGESAAELPPRFAELKQELWREEMVQSWKEVLQELEGAVEEVAARGHDMIPRISYADIRNGLSENQIASVRKTGTIIVTGGVPKKEALAWKQSIRDYVAANKDRVRGFPADNIQVFELYNAPALVAARTHPALIATQRALLAFWHASDPSSLERIDLDTPISYFDRLRIRLPGDSQFALGPHIDGGALERWEDPGFRKVFERILRRGAPGAEGKTWRDHDPFDVSPRLDAKQDLYNASNQCSIFRPWQGWTALSSTGPGEGTLRVLPMLSLATSYLMLRPFFRPRNSDSASLKFSDWEPDTCGPAFPGSAMRKTQELNPPRSRFLKGCDPAGTSLVLEIVRLSGSLILVLFHLFLVFRSSLSVRYFAVTVIPCKCRFKVN